MGSRRAGKGGQVVVLAQGPWFRVTFAETSILQCMAQFMTEAMQAAGEQDATGWCRNALMNFAVAANAVQERVHAPEHGNVSFFAGRRAPHASAAATRRGQVRGIRMIGGAGNALAGEPSR